MFERESLYIILLLYRRETTGDVTAMLGKLKICVKKKKKIVCSVAGDLVDFVYLNKPRPEACLRYPSGLAHGSLINVV